VRHAASYGYSSFIYDRIGCGQSEAPATGGFSALQAPTEVSVLENILGQLRNTTVVGGKKHKKITLMGHSYGSAQSQAISATSPNLIDGLVLTGFSTNASSTPSFFLAGTYTIANEVSTLPQLSSRPSVWLATASSIADIESFFDPPHYEQGALTYARSITQPVTLGSLTTIGAIGGVATNYKGPILVIDGARDLPFCGRNCYAPAPTGGNLAEAVKMLFPATSNFTSSILPNTGHGIGE
jgi:pimeloyl-ACP methyl ester carboxylesterase